MIKKLSKFVSIRGFGALPAPYSIMFVALCSVASVQAHAENSLKLGFGAGIGPKYSGSDKNVGKMAIGVDYQMDNGFFASTMRGLGYGASHGEFSYSVGLGYRGGRTDSSKNGFNMQSGSDYLRGMGDIKGSATALLSVAYTPIKWLSFDAMAELALSQRINGNSYHLGATGTLYETETDRISLAGKAHIGDKKFTGTYYGVTDKQSADSGFASHKAAAGLYAISTNVSWQHKFDEKWSLMTTAGVVSLTGDAAKSPIVKRKTSPTGSVYVSYNY